MKSLGRSVGAAAVVLVAAAACTPPPSPDPAPPVIESFEAVAPRTEAPVTVTLRWRISDPNADVLVCRVDIEGDGIIDRTVDPCPTKGDVLVQLTAPGSINPTLDVSDGTFDAPTASAGEVLSTPGPSEPFDITLHFGEIPAQFQPAFTAAAARWQQIIVDGWEPEQLSVPANHLGWIPAFEGPVDDVLIAVRSYPIDGPYNLLGQAGQLARRTGSGEPYFGMMEFDSDDLQRYLDDGELLDLILHEMGHVLGLGPAWLSDGRIDDLFTNPSYNGPAAGAAWHELGGTGNVPVEDQGGAGTWAVHWRESTFGTELMTGWSDPDEQLSRLSIAALADQGYGVDLTKADAYALPGGGAAARRAGPEPHQHTTPVPLLTEEQLRVLKD